MGTVRVPLVVLFFAVVCVVVQTVFVVFLLERQRNTSCDSLDDDSVLARALKVLQETGDHETSDTYKVIARWLQYKHWLSTYALEKTYQHRQTRAETKSTVEGKKVQ